MQIISAILMWMFQMSLQIVGILMGIFLMPFFLLFVNDEFKSSTYTTDGKNEWWLRRLPIWAKWWDNTVDGTLGDDNFRWAGRDIPFRLKNTSFLGQYWWMAIRNPFNYFKRFILGCDVRENKVELLSGQGYVRDDLNSTGWQFLKCGRYYTFYLVWNWPSTERAVVIQIGNKFDLEDNVKSYPKEQEYKYFKGFTAEFQIYKFIGEE